MNRSCRNTEMIVFFCGELIRIFSGREIQLSLCRKTKIAFHIRTIRRLCQTKIDVGFLGSTIQVIIAFILRKRHSKILNHILLVWMHLQGQIASFHGIQKIITNRIFRSKSRKPFFPNQLLWKALHKCIAGNIYIYILKGNGYFIFLK